MSQAQVVALDPPTPPRFEGQEGYHNSNRDKTHDRIVRGHSYRPMATIMLTPVRREGTLHKRFVECREQLIRPPNHAFAAWLLEGMEVGDAFNHGIWGILKSPDLMKWNEGRGPWIATLEDDNLPPPDAIVKLLADMYETPFAAVSGLYFTKGEGGCAQCWGDPRSYVVNFAPQVPQQDTIQEVRGIGMGCALWDIKLFQDERNRQGVGPDGCPIWFKTWSEVLPGGGVRMGTQDLSFAELAGRNGYRFAVDTSIRVGHADWSTSTVW